MRAPSAKSHSLPSICNITEWVKIFLTVSLPFQIKTYKTIFYRYSWWTLNWKIIFLILTWTPLLFSTKYSNAILLRNKTLATKTISRRGFKQFYVVIKLKTWFLEQFIYRSRVFPFFEKCIIPDLSRRHKNQNDDEVFFLKFWSIKNVTFFSYYLTVFNIKY